MRFRRPGGAFSRRSRPREAFFDDPDVAAAYLSFDGASIAYVAPVDGVRNLWVTITPLTRAESEQMVAMLSRRNAPVTYVVFPDEGHGFSKPKNQIAFRAVTEASPSTSAAEPNHWIAPTTATNPPPAAHTEQRLPKRRASTRRQSRQDAKRCW